jgi:hypothetical protein
MIRVGLGENEKNNEFFLFKWMRWARIENDKVWAIKQWFVHAFKIWNSKWEIKSDNRWVENKKNGEKKALDIRDAQQLTSFNFKGCTAGCFKIWNSN